MILPSFFHREETYGLVSQIRRSAIAMPSNIAEGSVRSHTKELVQFIYVTFASGAELETQLYIAKELKFLSAEKFEMVDKLLAGIMKMLNKLSASLTNH